MFKKSEEREWTQFRGALSSKDRDEAATVPVTPEPNDTIVGAAPGPTPPSPAAAFGPSFRSSSGDVNVGLPNARKPRSAVNDSVEVETSIGERTNFEGTLKTEGPVRLLGSIQGEIDSKSTIIVEEKAHVTARLTASQITVAGHVDGQIYCEGRSRSVRPATSLARSTLGP